MVDWPKAGIGGALAEKNLGVMLGFPKKGSSKHDRALIDRISEAADSKAIIRELFSFSRDKIGVGQMSAIVAGTLDPSQLA
jgi:hypothetical protein